MEMWRESPEMDSMWLALFDTWNGFNELPHYQMLWNVLHRWAKGSQFAFNCCPHYKLVIVRREDDQPAHVIVHKRGSESRQSTTCDDITVAND